MTRLRGLDEAEPFIKAGIPLVASVAFERTSSTGPRQGTNGHLIVIVGFTGTGTCRERPGVADGRDVQHVYDREQFERAWIPASGGIVYVIRPPGWPERRR